MGLLHWWGKRDSNPHALRHVILSHARLPIPTFPLDAARTSEHDTRRPTAPSCRISLLGAIDRTFLACNLRSRTARTCSAVDREAVATLIGNFEIVAESKVHFGRRLLVNPSGVGHIQLDQNSMPMPMPEADFARLLAMSHYNPVTPMAKAVGRSERLAG